VTPRRLDLHRRFVDEWPEVLRHPVLLWPEHRPERMRVEEFAEGGTFIVRVDLPGIDPEKDVEISLVGDMLHIDAERREEEKTEERDYVRREIHYGSFHRELPVPKGTLEADIQASYKDGMLEVRAPMTKGEVEAAKKIPVTKKN
jgi:HSP20 family protein